MRRLALVIALLALGLAAPCGVRAQDTAPDLTPVPPLTRDLDGLLRAAWTRTGVTVAPDAAPGELLRRLTLDLVGRVPTIDETRAFVGSGTVGSGTAGSGSTTAVVDPLRLRTTVERLLASRECAERFADGLTTSLLGREAQQEGLDKRRFRDWLASRLEADAPLDELAGELLGARTDDANEHPASYYLLLGGGPPDLAGRTARFFLGNRIQCAQCHDHPYESWKRTDFWQLAAYFQRVKRDAVREPLTDDMRRKKVQPRVVTWKLDESPTGETQIPLQPGEEGRPALALPRFLGGTYDLALEGPNQRRLPALVAAVTRQKRPLFARAMANRFFAELFGRGVVNPVDDFSESRPPALPEVLARLAQGLEEGGMRLRPYLRALLLTSAYARSSFSREPVASDQGVGEARQGEARDARDPAAWKGRGKAAGDDPALDVFARMRHKPLTPEQALGAYVTASRSAEAARAEGDAAVQQWHKHEAQILQRFVGLMARNDEEDPHSIQESIPQALVLMNGPDSSFFCQARKGTTPALAAAETDVDARIDLLYLAAFSRRPTDGERRGARAFFAGQKDATKATEDYFWSLLNSSEFLYNH